MAEPLRTPDFEVPPRQPAAAQAEPTGDGVRVSWTDGHEAVFHALWLRENAPDPTTTHPVSREPLLPLLELPADLHARAVKVVDSGRAVQVAWSHDRGESRFDADWLRHRHVALTDERDTLPGRALWPKRDGLPLHDGRAVLNDVDGARRAWMHDLYTVGATVITGLPAEQDRLDALAAVVGPMFVSNFGRIFDVRVEEDIASNASTDIALPVHTDLATRSRPPGLQFLQCMANSAAGGHSVLVDGFALLAEIEATDPEAYASLCRVPCTFASRSPTSDYRHTGPAVELDARGRPAVFRLSPWLRYGFVADPDETASAYRALRLALAMSAEPARAVQFRLEPGQILCFDNVRMLHGRTALGELAGRRWLRGCYLDLDDLVSHLRMARR